MKLYKKYLSKFLDQYDGILSSEIIIKFEELGEICTDTRKLKKNDIFIALSGENFNGNNFVQIAFENGAAFCISEEINSNSIHVKSTLDFIQKFSAFILQEENKIFKIGITGTNGKTSTKEIMASVLGQKFVVHKTQGNNNNNIGLPLTILDLNENVEVLILEMGTNSPGEIEVLSNIARPNLSVITNIGKGHTLYLKNENEILREKFNITKFFGPENFLIFNADNKLLAEKCKNLGFKTMSFSINSDSDTKGEEISDSYDEFSIEINKEEIKIKIKAAGINNIYNSLSVVAAAKTLNIEPELIKKGLEEYGGISNRFNIKKTGTNFIINDSYNANPNSMKTAIQMTNAIFPKLTKIAIIGDMLELGDFEEDEHKKIGELLCFEKFNEAYIYGSNYKSYLMGINQKISTTILTEHRDISNFLDLKKIHNTVILIKGSRGSKMEKVLEFLEI